MILIREDMTKTKDVLDMINSLSDDKIVIIRYITNSDPRLIGF